MKKVATLAVILGLLSGAASAESAVNEAPELTLAMNSNSANLWVVPAAAIEIEDESLADQIELKTSKSMEKISDALNKQLEEKIAKELEYAMH